jgi:hypothetical protein
MTRRPPLFRTIAFLLVAFSASAFSRIVRAADPVTASPVPVPAMPSLLPLPAQMLPRSGHFHVTADTPIVVAAGDVEMRRSADYLRDLLTRTRALHLQVRTGGSVAHAIVLRRDPPAPGDTPRAIHSMSRPTASW